ncbi:Protein kinase domain [Macleaya cordata]|uniref:non-specific serine/threonine protein kinase n=1 Tax=Macleaya cordata TaxID=56857 RepID=A0A200Q0W0_MACCD|nr:Protein kinase domain [Macleaya cordata]
MEGQFLTSAGGIFELGFFRPSNSSKIYVGIWHKRITLRKIVWVANRDKPLMDSSGILTISSNGNLAILDGNGNTIWTTNTSTVTSAVAVLVDSGNLVLKESSTQEGKVLWESFNHPSDTFLPNMKIGLNLKTGDKNLLTSWKTENDPSPGDFIVGLDPKRPVQAYIWDISNGTVPYFRSGLWNGKSFIGIEGMDTVYFNGYSLAANDPEQIYFTFSVLNNSLVSFLVVNSSGGLKHVTWDEVQNEWTVVGETPRSRCEIYSTCGPNASCNKFDSPICRCLRGFEPKSNEEWSKGNWRDGCVRRTQLQCGKNTTNSVVKEDGFLQLRGMKLPDFAEYLEIPEAEKCELQCLKNCSCVGYAHVSGLWCLVWSGELMDVQKFSIGGEDLFLRLASSELRTSTRLPGLVDSVITEESFKESPNKNMFKDGVNEGKTPELQLFDFASLAVATNNFSFTNKLGEGGFGPVYKGKFQSGQEIAVKRLSKSSGQGIEEFKNEVILISKLQHRNLVRLLGCCTEGEENMLIYEYMPNKSLDAFLFDPRKKAQLDWNKRFNIIGGIARGLLYLHRDSRLRVIHRDLKVSNILLDEDMNPKISDFGMARIFGGNQTIANTNRVVGTFGYMSPEYAMDGRFSEKSDVFSFGVLLLEIVSGRRNTSFYHHELSLSLLGYAWQLWNENKMQSLIDPSLLSQPFFEVEILRCIHVGLLCVQEFANDRPTMSTTLSMLTSEITPLRTPKQPAFTVKRVSSDPNSSQNSQKACSINNLTITVVEALMTTKTRKTTLHLLSSLLLCFLLFFQPCTSIDFLTSTQPLNDGQTITSSGGVFELGFFSPQNSKNSYVGIWYKKIPIQTVIWVANRETPLTDSSGSFTIKEDGNLAVLNRIGDVLWSSSASSITLKNSTARLLDTGNLILSEGNTGKVLWQSFDYPTDSFVPTMRLAVDLKTGERQSLTSWRSENDPSPGNFSVSLDPQRLPQVFVYKDSKPIWRSGQWNGKIFIGLPRMISVYQGFNIINDNDANKVYVTYLSGDVFITWRLMNKCEDECLKNCSCKAYAFVNGIGCTIWDHEFVDIQKFQGGGNTLFIRLAESELGGSKKISKLVIVIAVVLGAIFSVASAYLLWRNINKLKGICRKGNKEIAPVVDLSRSKEMLRDFSGEDNGEGDEEKGPQVLSYNIMETATNNFSTSNRLGQGGFGDVYKAIMPCGQEVAVKRLSRRSGQGLEEFKTEVILIAKLQHRNLVRILGCCIEEEEKMLVYEYMPNKSLDAFIFDSTKQLLLDWPKRFNIIEGISRGLLYLHRDSRLRIIHRDLKASNILLDGEMNPKISDFGMAKIFGGNQNQANTNRVVGTYGYMSPEYAMEGLFSVKSDVYSFGVLLLEIVSGKKNSYFHHTEQYSNLLAYAWNLWNEGKAMEFADPSIRNSCVPFEVCRCIHVGLLCVQDSTIDRPTMSSVVLMLESESATLPRPKPPTFTIGRSPTGMDLSIEEHEIVSTNDVTVTVILGR